VVGVRKAALLLTLMVAAAFSWASEDLMAQEGTTLVPEQTTTPELTPAQSVIPGQYTVVLKEETRDPTAVAREHARGYGARVLHTYQHALKGYTARIPHERLEKALAEEHVDYVELDQRAHATAQTLP
jgi:Peptidase inhibitor I9